MATPIPKVGPYRVRGHGELGVTRILLLSAGSIFFGGRGLGLSFGPIYGLGLKIRWLRLGVCHVQTLQFGDDARKKLRRYRDGYVRSPFCGS